MNNNLSSIILCGGKGLRLRPITKDIPKPLVRINNKPMLYYIIQHLKKFKINQFIIATGYKSEKIEEFMKCTFPKLNYKIVKSGNVNTLVRIKKCLKHIDGDFLLSYGDTLSNININKLISFHKLKPNKATISSFPITIPFGVMELTKSGIVKSFKEKPILNEVMNIGYYYFTKSFHELIKKEKDLLSLINKLVYTKQLRCYQHDGVHITINTITELEYAKNNIKTIY